MICPRCAASLTGKQRNGRIRAHCGKRFALDPAVHGKGMHDIPIRGIAERATDHGRLRITLTQLWYLFRSRNYAWAGRDPQGVPAKIRWLVALPEADAEWLGEGFWGPLAAVPPRVLESIVVRAVERAPAAPRPTPRETLTHGFLTWPQAPWTPRTSRAPGARPPGTYKKRTGTYKKGTSSA